MSRLFNPPIVVLTLVVATVLFGIAPSNAAVVTDPLLTTGPDAIDPLAPDANAGAIDDTGLVAGAATKADLLSVPSFSVIQSFTGFGAQQANYFNFTDPARPDVRILTNAGNGSAAANTGNGTSSGGSAQYLGSGPLPWGQVMEFGTYDSVMNTFTADRSVSAAGFMLTRTTGGNARYTATFLDDASNVLSTQQIVTAGGSAAHLFGYISGSANIRRINLAFDQVQVNTFMDDFGFTTAPPASPKEPFALAPQLNNFNGSFENNNVALNAPTSNLTGSNGSFDSFDANVLTLDNWAPYFADPNNVVGRYGQAGSLTTNSFYLDTLSGSGGGTNGVRRLTLNSVDGYVNGVVNADVLDGIDPRFLNPNVKIKIVVDVGRGAGTTVAANATATATLALTQGVGAAATDLSNAIASDTVQQSTLSTTTSATQLELILNGGDLAVSGPLNIVVQSVNTLPTTGESTIGRDPNRASQANFDNVRVLAYLPGDADGDFDVDGADLAAWKANFGGDNLTNVQGDFDVDGDADGADFLVWQRNHTGSLTPLATVAGAAIPEPATAIMAMAAASLALLRRRA